MISVYPFGRYTHRQPLAYASVQAACKSQVQVVADFAQADVIVVAHDKDLQEGGGQIRAQLGAGQRLVMLSEEPLWDTVWFADPLTRVQSYETAEGVVPLTVLNHHTSSIFDFARIPYFLLTENSYFARYAHWFARNGAMSVQDWRRRLAHPRHNVAFLAELRQSDIFDVCLNDATFGLGAHRTRVALNCEGPRVLRSGAGWNALPRRQDLRDWHLEKFLDLDGQCQLMSAIENTHQRNYVSEKIFDAFAIGAIPLYIADSKHRVHDIVPDGSFVNLIGLTPEDAGEQIMQFTLDDTQLEAFMQAQQALASLFSGPDPWQGELERLGRALAVELQRVLEE